MLSQILSRNTQIAVSEATDRTAVEPNHIYVIPANADLSIQHGVLQVGARKPGHMAVDSFFRALAEDRTDHAIGVVLSGNGSDGALGLAAIKAAGGSTLAQDPQAAKFDDMPRAAIGLGDVAMPDHDGLYLVSEIRRLHGNETPAIALTGLASGVERQSIISAGFDECANKPVAPQKLMEIAAALVRRWGTRTNSLPHHDYLNLRL
jgi:CheY-like chemotaxis protein